jgi:hypothetical protein
VGAVRCDEGVAGIEGVERAKRVEGREGSFVRDCSLHKRLTLACRLCS